MQSYHVFYLSLVLPKKNLALYKNAWMPSLFDTKSPANKAVDGLLGTSATDNECAITKSMTNPWWAVDLGQPRNIEYVIVTTRTGIVER